MQKNSKKSKSGFAQFKVVLKKELIDVFRDRKSIIATFLVPLILFPVMFAIIGLGSTSMVDKAINPKIAIMQFDEASESAVKKDSELYNFVNDELLAASQSMGVNFTIIETKDPVTALVDGEISAILKVEKGIDTLGDTGNKSIKLIYDERSTMGSSSISSLASIISVYQNKIYNDRLENSVLPGTDIEDLNGIIAGDVSLDKEYPELVRQGAGSPLISMLVPFLLAFLLAVGGLSVAIDLVAGEKERNTFEALLSTSANRFSILSAKFVVIILFSFISAIVQCGSLFISMFISPNMFFGEGAFNIPLGALGLAFLNVLLLACLYSSLLLVLSASAKTYKEASTKASFVSLIPFVGYVVMFMEAADIGMGFMFVPILNVVCVLKMVLSGYISYAHILTSVLVNVVVVTVAIWYTLKTFKNEKLITKG